VDIVEGAAAKTGGDLGPVNGAGGQSSGIITQTGRNTGVAYPYLENRRFGKTKHGREGVHRVRLVQVDVIGAEAVLRNALYVLADNGLTLKFIDCSAKELASTAPKFSP
jgi:hypothetical protein